MAAKGKVARNLRLVEAAFEGGGPATPELLLDLGRSLKAAGRLDEAAQRFADAAAAGPDSRVARQALQFEASCLLGLGRLDDAEHVIERLRATARNHSMADFLTGQLLL